MQRATDRGMLDLRNRDGLRKRGGQRLRQRLGRVEARGLFADHPAIGGDRRLQGRLRAEGGRLRANYEAVNLSTFTAEIASAFCPAMEKAGLKYVIDCVPFPEPAYVDSEMWEKIVLNLISNAFKYTIKGEVTVTVSVSADGKTAQLSVRDTGTGIPAQELPRLFERFHRIEGQVGRTFEGTGIGLALVQELVRLHEGSIRVTSVEGEGSTFTVTIPLGTKAASLDRAADSTRAAPVRPRAQAFLDETLRWLPGEPESREERESDDLVQTDFPGSALDSPVPQERAVVLVVDDNSDMRDYIRLIHQLLRWQPEGCLVSQVITLHRSQL